MSDCPYCHNPKIRFSRYMTLHIVRAVVGSEKRYCENCDKKWRVRARRKGANISFYAVAVPLALGITFGMLRMSDMHTPSIAKSDGSQGSSSASGSTLQKMALGSMMGKAMASKTGGSKMDAPILAGLAGLSGSNRKMAERAMKNMSTNEIQSKIQKLQSNPQALSRLSGERKEVVEQALKLMKNQQRRK